MSSTMKRSHLRLPDLSGGDCAGLYKALNVDCLEVCCINKRHPLDPTHIAAQCVQQRLAARVPDADDVARDDEIAVVRAEGDLLGIEVAHVIQRPCFQRIKITHPKYTVTRR